MGSKKGLELPIINSRLYLGGFVIVKNYLKTLKLYLVKCWRKDRAILPLPVVELGLNPLYLACAEIGYSLYVFIINGRLFFNQDRLKYQALSSLSYCSFPMIQPLLVRICNVKPQKYISAKQFNYLTYIIMNNKCK